MANPRIKANAVLTALYDGGQCLKIHALSAATKLDAPDVSKALNVLAAASAVEHSSRGCWRLTAAGKMLHLAGGISKRQTGTRNTGPTAQQANGASGIRARVWNAMRISGALAIEAILTRVDTGDTVNARATVTRYLRGLIRAGIVTINRRNYVLLRNLGPFAPTVGRRHVFDPNTGKPVPYIEEPSQ